MSVVDARERMQAAWEAAQAAWLAAHEVWRDEVALRFEREFWTEMEAAVVDVLGRLQDLEDAIARAP